jgi:hypothetical protein
VPFREMVSVGLEAFDVTVTVPLAVPVEVGANLTEYVALCPAVRVKEELIPLRVNPAPLMVTFETETLVPPVFVIVPDKDWFEPTVTLPKFRELGLELSCPAVAVPVPDKEMVSVGFEALDVTVTVPLALPVVAGANLTE